MTSLATCQSSHWSLQELRVLIKKSRNIEALSMAGTGPTAQAFHR